MTQYARGRRKEWAACKFLRETGWTVTRSAGSHGLWDVVAVKADRIWLIQVKYAKADNLWMDKNAEKFVHLRVPDPVERLFFIYLRGVAKPEMIFI